MTAKSWDLKLRRAEQHLADLEGLIESYVASNPYRAVCPAPPKRKPCRWRFVLEMVQPPDPWLAVVLGDFLFDVRSALDHVAVAIAPANRQSNAGFPIIREPIFMMGPLVKDVSEKREVFERNTRGMPPDAIAIIKQVQPCDGREDALHALAALGIMRNADTHRRLNVFAVGLTDPLVRVSWGTDGIGIGMTAYLKPGAELVRSSDIGNQVRYDEVDVQLTGTLHVSAVVSEGDYELFGPRGIGPGMLAYVRQLIGRLEPFARA